MEQIKKLFEQNPNIKIRIGSRVKAIDIMWSLPTFLAQGEFAGKMKLTMPKARDTNGPLTCIASYKDGSVWQCLPKDHGTNKLTKAISGLVTLKSDSKE